MDEKIQLAKEVSPDTLYGYAKHGTTFIFTKNNRLHTGDLRDMHIDMLQQPELKAEIKSLGVGTDNSTVIEQVALVGRVGFLSRPIKVKLPWEDVPDVQATICSFWNKDREILKALLKPCLNSLIKQHILNLEDIVVYPPYTLPRHVSDFFMVKNKAKEDLNKAMNPEQQKKIDLWKKLHMMQGNEKKQAMTTLGVGATKDRPTDFIPGRKSWASTSEALINFKDWFNKLIVH